MSNKPIRKSRADFIYFARMPTRWKDNDAYGHLNNVIYYELFDTAINTMIANAGLLDPAHSDPIDYVVDSGCSYFESVAYPDELEVGLIIEKLGTSSVRYNLGVFQKHAGPCHDLAAAQGHFTHVYVSRATRRPVAIPDDLRALFSPLVRAAHA